MNELEAIEKAKEIKAIYEATANLPSFELAGIINNNDRLRAFFTNNSWNKINDSVTIVIPKWLHMPNQVEARRLLAYCIALDKERGNEKL